VLPEPEVEVPEELLDRARATFTAFRAAMTELQGDPYSGTLPRDPDYLAWTLSALAPLPMAERQSLLEAEDATERLILVTQLLTDELRAINVIPSLPATQVARTAWSPN
jgi:Lon protease-like protein